MPKLIVMVGPPGVGKSTWIKNFDPEGKFTVVSSDNILEEWAAEQGTTYAEIFDKAVGAATKEMKERAKAAFQRGDDVIWDQTMMGEKSRKTPIQMCRSNGRGYEMEAVVFSLTDQEHQRRIQARTQAGGKTVPQFVVENMLRRFEMPTKDEGFSKITVVKD